jgi:addiction module RelE/StbE family toxin
MTAEKTFRHICVTSPFRRAAKRAGKQFSQLADEIMAAVELLEADMFAPVLKTHKLRGDLKGCWACSVNCSVRIVFAVGAIETIDGVTAETILLLSVGTHDEVY